MASLVSKSLPYLVRLLLVLLVSTPFIVIFLSLETQPSVAERAPLSRLELSKIEQLLLDNTPAVLGNYSIQTLQLDEEELNLLQQFALEVTNRSPQWAADLTLNDASFTTRLSIRASESIIPLFINIDAHFIVTNGLLTLDAVQLGRLKIPDGFLTIATSSMRDRANRTDLAFQELDQLLANIDQVSVNRETMGFILEWDPQLINNFATRTQQLFISDGDRDKIVRYYRQIGDIAATIPADIRAVSLNAFLKPLFDTAARNSAQGADPIAENRALLQTLAVYVNDEDIGQLLGVEQARSLPSPKVIEVRLQRRQDLAQHLVSIAAITASAGMDLAQLLSTTKEAYDARYRSGFSFSDLAANNVGAALAELSTRNRELALLMQIRLGVIQSESEYMPAIGNNRDGLSESDFNAIYQNRNSQEYQNRLREIETMINNSPVFEGLFPY